MIVPKGTHTPHNISRAPSIRHKADSQDDEDFFFNNCPLPVNTRTYTTRSFGIQYNYEHLSCAKLKYRN